MRPRPRAHAPLVAALCTLLACSAVPSTADAATRAVRVVRNVAVPTSDGSSIPIDVWRPRATASSGSGAGASRRVARHPRPVALLVHGGGWHTGDKKQWEQSRWAQRLVGRGWLVVNANYRLACALDGTVAASVLDETETRTIRAAGRERAGRGRDPRLCGHAMQTSLADVRQALRYTSSHARGWGGDPHRIVLFGASAGSHLAMLAASDARRPRGVRAVVALSPPTDMVAIGRDASLPIYGSARLAIGCGLDACPSAWTRMSPISVVRRGVTPPTWMFDASADPITPIAQVRAYAASLRAAGVAVSLATTANRRADCHGPIPCAAERLAGGRGDMFEQSQRWLLRRMR